MQDNIIINNIYISRDIIVNINFYILYYNLDTCSNFFVYNFDY
jgi:hypothetical protein